RPKVRTLRLRARGLIGLSKPVDALLIGNIVRLHCVRRPDKSKLHRVKPSRKLKSGLPLPFVCDGASLASRGDEILLTCTALFDAFHKPIRVELGSLWNPGPML